MKIKRKPLIIIISILTIIVLFFSFQKWGRSLNPAAEILSEQEAQKLIEDRYKGGSVTKITLDDDQYLIEMDRGESQYEIQLDAEHGEVISFSKIPNNPVIENPTPTQEPTTDEKTLTETEIKASVLAEAPGELLFFKKINEKGQSFYKAVVLENGQKTILKIDATTGEILMRKVEKDKKSLAKITEEEAGKIAIKEVKGTINDIDLEDEDNLLFYLVEIETPDDEEATVQIDAITGAILTISWDD